ncbi:hypothetical protein [Leptolyngbya sp. FACHB-17]|uniref:hypothetical protein n=1 Tax=unclassified Leptolyngbya TaxID=2650499 RepID=UPI00168111A2|nr:hypothetical protein [Leptolyngbya sp. FACHB-17]MBD2078673.1 hypothetical protein [Leptolyngbya sp. FACHB-17]
MRKSFNSGLIGILVGMNALSVESLMPPAVHAQGCHWTDITCNPHIRKHTREIAEQAWGEAGAAAYQSAAQWMRANNGSSQGFDETQNRYLRPHFGDLLDRVAVVYNANLMDEWSAGGYRIRVGGVESAAQTYCERIYVNAPYKPGDSSQLKLLAHELVHSKQCEQLGGTGKFGFHYFREYKRAGQNYENNKLEREAYDFGKQFATWLSNQLASNPAPIIDWSFDARFRAVNDWASKHSYVSAFPNFHQANSGSGLVYGGVLLNSGTAVLRDVPVAELGNPSTDEERFRAVNDWAARNGYVAGFPNFHQADNGQGVVFGVVLLNSGTAVVRDVPMAELGNPQTNEDRFRAVNDWAIRQGYAAAFPNFHQADHGQGVVFGVVLLNSGTAVLREIPVSQLR